MTWYVAVWGVLSCVALVVWTMVGAVWLYNLRRPRGAKVADLKRQVGYLEADAEDYQRTIKRLRKEVEIAASRQFGVHSP